MVKKILALMLTVLIVSSLTATLFLIISVGPGKTPVACMGDSITQQTGYPHSLQTLLGANFSVGNFGVVGATVSFNSDRPYTNQAEFEAAGDFNPQIVILMLGTNDARDTIHTSIEQFTRNYQTLITRIKNFNNHPQIWLLTPPPVFSNTLGVDSTYLADELLPCVRQVAQDENLTLIDVYSSLLPHPDYFSDGVHPNSQGAHAIAALVFNAISQSTS
jgi:acyl-CoA thioesterase I